MTNSSLPPDSPRSAQRRAELAQTWLSEEEVLTRLGIDHQALSALRRSRTLLAVWHAPEGRYLYPPCQFIGELLIPEIVRLLGYLDYGVTGSGWDEVEWLYAGNAYLNGNRPADVLPQDPSKVLRIAEQQFTEDPDSRW